MAIRAIRSGFLKIPKPLGMQRRFRSIPAPRIPLGTRIPLFRPVKWLAAGIGTGVAALSTLYFPHVVHCKTNCPELLGLEQFYENENFGTINVREQVDFDKYHSPNERRVEEIQPHLDAITEDGIFVTTGTERAFFETALKNTSKKGGKFTGVIIRDIDPQAIAYDHMIILMLRIAKDRKDFAEMSGPNRGKGHPNLSKQEIQGKIEMLRKRIDQAGDLPLKAKEFYLKNLQDFAPIYFRTNNTWRTCGGDKEAQEFWAQESLTGESLSKESFATSFRGVQYHQDSAQFQELQKLAKAGRITATVGSINDLQFIKHNITALDVSNIPDYIPMDFAFSVNQTPVIMWNTPENPFERTHYRSCRYNPQEQLTKKEKEEMTLLLNQMVDAKVLPRYTKGKVPSDGYLARSFLKHLENGRDPYPFGYHRKHLDVLRKYREEWMCHTEKYGFGSYGPTVYRETVMKPPVVSKDAIQRKCKTDQGETDLDCVNAFFKARLQGFVTV